MQTETDSNQEANQPPTYEIKSVKDFLKVPPERLPYCLEEFADFIEKARSMSAIFNILAEQVSSEVGYPVESNPEISFTWIDDGSRNVIVTVS